MSAAAAIAAGRRSAERLMVDTCTIRRRGAETLNTTTLRYEPSWTTVYSGPCRLTVDTSTAEEHETGGQLLTDQQWVLNLPYATSAGVAVDDVAEITSQGLTVRVRGRFAQTFATARRLPVEVTS